MLPPGSKSKTHGLLIALSFCIAFAIVGFYVPQTASAAVEALKTATPSDQKDAEAREAMAHADRLLGEWQETSLRKAIEEYDRAGQIWRSIGDFTNASRAALKSGDVYFFLSQFHDARKIYQDARDLAVKKRDRLAEANALSHMARVDSYFGNNDLAQKNVNRALELLKRDDTNALARSAYGKALIVLGEIVYAKGNWKKASVHFDEALKYLNEDRESQAQAHLFIAYIAGSIGNPEKARAEITQAHDLCKAINNKRGEGLAVTALGKYYSLKSNQSGATKLQLTARDIFRVIGDRHSEAITLNALGEIHERLRDHKTAFNYYQEALHLFQESDALDATPLATCNIARMYYHAKNVDQALTHYDRCLSLSRAAGKQRIEVIALGQIATVYADQGQYDLASQQHQKIRRFYEAIGDQRGILKALNTHGDFLLNTGQDQKALEVYNQALTLSGKVGDQALSLTTLYNIARTNLKLNALESALSLIRRSISIIEEQRAHLSSADFRLSYFSGVQKHYKLCSEILMRLDRLRPGAGFGEEALRISEQGRARLLLDLITKSGADLLQGPAAKELLEREREIRGFFRSQTQYRLDLSLSKKDPPELKEVDDEMAQLRADYQHILAQLRQQGPQLKFLDESPSLNLQQIQNELRDSDTMILEYELGDEHSYVWAITANSFRTYELSSPKDIKKAALEVYDFIKARQQADVEALYFEKLRNLSQMLLGPLADQLGNKRLVVIADGALRYIPFDVLLVPAQQTPGPTGSESASRTFLVATNEVVALPSISTLMAIRGTRKDAGSTSKLVAVIADPVFSRNDERVQSASCSPQVATDHNSLEAPDAWTFTRLAHTSDEADRISEKAPRGTTLVAKGFDANRETAMSSNVGQYQIVHFATHSFVDRERPESSGIVLTQLDRNGVKTEGLMLLRDIYNSDLSSELVVLSACQTALGEDVNGEGLVGLNHAFMSAGARSVVASLWKVDDRATAALMDKFYDAMFQKGMSPAAALRSAKREMMRDKQWNDPYFWAGFVLQGEYENHIAVDHYSWLRPRVVLLSLGGLIAAGLFVFYIRKRRFSPPHTS